MRFIAFILILFFLASVEYQIELVNERLVNIDKTFTAILAHIEEKQP